MAFQYLEKLLPQGAILWYPMNEIYPNGQGATSVPDWSGNLRSLTQTVDAPVWQAFTDRGATRMNLYFGVNANPVRKDFAATVNLKHFFVIAKADGTAFNAYRGLASGLDDANFTLLASSNTGTKFYDNGYTAGDATYKYKKSQVLYAENNQQAPFAKPELIEISKASGWDLDGFQLGQNKDQDAQRWLGRIGEPLGYGRILSPNEIAAVNLYYDLKHGLWRKNDTTLNFPSPNITGLYYSRFFADTPDWKKVTNSHEYEDGGKSFNESSDDAPRRWEVEFNFSKQTHSESKSYTDIFDAFWNEARLVNKFNFTDKYGVTWSNVQIEDYNRSHSAHKSWSQSCQFKLVKLP